MQASNDQRDSDREQFKSEMAMRLEAQRLDFEKWKAELDARVKLRIAAIGKEASGDELMAELDENAEPQAKPLDRLTDMHAQTLQMIAGLTEAMARPKQIIRDANGRAQGVA